VKNFSKVKKNDPEMPFGQRHCLPFSRSMFGVQEAVDHIRDLVEALF
jgi:hypothetical protein